MDSNPAEDGHGYELFGEIALKNQRFFNAQHVNEVENASDDEMQHFEKQVITFLNTKLGTCIESSDIHKCQLKKCDFKCYSS